jgi:hypothetical protein
MFLVLWQFTGSPALVLGPAFTIPQAGKGMKGVDLLKSSLGTHAFLHMHMVLYTPGISQASKTSTYILGLGFLLNFWLSPCSTGITVSGSCDFQ